MNRLLILFFVCFSFNCAAQENTEFEKGTHNKLPYRMLWPENFDRSEKYPIILFLHGAGERGNDNQKQLVHGSSMFLQSRRDRPAIVILPQCPADDYWAKVDVTRNEGQRTFVFKPEESPTKSMQAVLSLIDSISQLPFIDNQRCYVGGISMGGMGTFEIISRRPDKFAAAFPICGGGNPATAAKFADNVNLWVFHGAKDDVVLPKYSEDMVRAIQEVGGNVKYTLYPGANHNSWDSAFAEPDLLPWLFSNSK